MSWSLAFVVFIGIMLAFNFFPVGRQLTKDFIWLAKWIGRQMKRILPK